MISNKPIAKKIVIMGIDNFSRKNILQVKLLNSLGYFFDIFSTDFLNDSKENTPQGNNLYILNNTFFGRMVQILLYMLKKYKHVSHIEIYPGGRFALFYILFSKLFYLKTITVERGDIKNYYRCSVIQRFSMYLCYRYSDFVWYREPYAYNLLKKIKVKRMFFLSNAVEIDDRLKESSYENKSIDFLWVNRLIRERKSEWFVDILEQEFFKNTNNVILGLLDNTKDKISHIKQENICNRKLKNLKIYPYMNPKEFYITSRFFVLPSDIVFCNNSLLEAMSYGVIPIISQVDSIELIIEDNHNGITFLHTKEGLEKAMKRALSLSKEEYRRISRNAQLRITEKFSLEQWKDGILKLYGLINN